MTIQKLANQALEMLETKVRTNGNNYVCFKDDRPQWMQDLAFRAHNNGEMLPNDYRYEFIESALTAIASHDDIEDARDSIEADIYTSDLMAWLASRNDRYQYVDSAIEDYGKGVSVIDDIRMGQCVERLEVFEAVANFLKDMTEFNKETS